MQLSAYIPVGLIFWMFVALQPSRAEQISHFEFVTQQTVREHNIDQPLKEFRIGDDGICLMARLRGLEKGRTTFGEMLILDAKGRQAERRKWRISINEHYRWYTVWIELEFKPFRNYEPGTWTGQIIRDGKVLAEKKISVLPSLEQLKSSRQQMIGSCAIYGSFVLFLLFCAVAQIREYRNEERREMVAASKPVPLSSKSIASLTDSMNELGFSRLGELIESRDEHAAGAILRVFKKRGTGIYATLEEKEDKIHTSMFSAFSNGVAIETNVGYHDRFINEYYELRWTSSDVPDAVELHGKCLIPLVARYGPPLDFEEIESFQKWDAFYRKNHLVMLHDIKCMVLYLPMATPFLAVIPLIMKILEPGWFEMDPWRQLQAVKGYDWVAFLTVLVVLFGGPAMERLFNKEGQ